MSLRHLLFIAVLAILGMPGTRSAAQDSSPTQKKYRELARLLNVVKKAPQDAYRHQARLELEQRGISRLDMVLALTLDQWLLESDDLVRFRASAELGQMRSPARLLAVANLRRLIAVEGNPDLVWMHAVTLSSIAPEMGNALDVIEQIPEDPILADVLRREMQNPDPIVRSNNERAISEIALDWTEYRKLEMMLRLARHGNPDDSPFILSYASPAPTLIGTRPAIAERKKMLHPLIVAGKFDDILQRMKDGSEDHWMLFADNAHKFPQPHTARVIVGQAFQSDLAKSQRAMRALRTLGEDGEAAAALVDAMFSDLNFAHAVDHLNRIEQPGPYAQDALRRAKRHGYPQVRAAVIRAMSRSPELSAMLTETLRESLLTPDREMRDAVQKVMLECKIANPITAPWLEEQILATNDLDRLSILVERLKGLPVSAEFRQKLLERIDPFRSAETSLIFIGCLLDHSDPQSESAAKLRMLQAETESLLVAELAQRLETDLRWMIEQSKIIKRQSEAEGIEQFETLLKLANE